MKIKMFVMICLLSTTVHADPFITSTLPTGIYEWNDLPQVLTVTSDSWLRVASFQSNQVEGTQTTDNPHTYISNKFSDGLWIYSLDLTTILNPCNFYQHDFETTPGGPLAGGLGVYWVILTHTPCHNEPPPPVVTPPIDTPPIIAPPIIEPPIVTPPIDTPPVVTPPPIDVPPIDVTPVPEPATLTLLGLGLGTLLFKKFR